MGIMDPTLNLFVLSGIFAYTRMISSTDRSYLYAILASASLAMAFLIKGPIAIVIPSIVFVIYFLFYEKSQFNLKHNIIFILLLFIFSTSWYIIESFRNGFWFIEQFATYQFRLISTADAGHKGFFLFHFVVFMLLCFPASTFFIKGFTDNWKSDGFSKIMALLFVVVMVIFFIVKTKIVHYSSLVYVPGCYFAALTIRQFLKRERTSLTRLEWSLLSCSLIVYLILTLVVPILVNRPELIIPFIHNLNVVESISQNIHWPLSGFFPGIFLFLSGVVICYLFYRKSIMPGMKFLIISTMIFTNSLWAFYLPLLEKYLQGDLIQYYKEVKDQPIDLTTYKYKTYAHMFYAGKKVFRSVEDYNQSEGRQPSLHIITRKKDQSKIEERYPVNLLHNFGQFLVYEYIP
jgi:4-amino-4-deoxy-L-arabinose transferase-like glycosyltransferase